MLNLGAAGCTRPLSTVTFRRSRVCQAGIEPRRMGLPHV